MSKILNTINHLTSALRDNPNAPVIFTQNELAISPGYHITEVKSSVVHSLDCGQGTDQWHEIVIQLLDGNANSSGTFMQSSTMLGILKKALRNEPVDDNTKLYFEFSPQNLALQIFSISAIEEVNNSISITLNSAKPQCKPYQRALANSAGSSASNGCCNVDSTSRQACCNTNDSSASTRCCA